MEALHKELIEKIHGKILFNESMQKHTTFRIGGPVDIMILPKDLDDVKCTVAYAKKNGVALQVIGNGSKLLVNDQGIRGIIIKITNTLGNLDVVDESVIADAGCLLSTLIHTSRKLNLSGMEFAAGIPATLGGAIWMNAGTPLGSISEVIDEVTAMNPSDCSMRVFSREECHFGLRQSIFQKNQFIILQAKLQLKKGDPGEIDDKIAALIQKRQKTQPLNLPNAGCIFKNPVGQAAGQLVDRLGLKGLKFGGAEISQVHANFIVNLGGARAADVLALMNIMRKKVYGSFGLVLEPELRLLEMSLGEVAAKQVP